MAFQKPQYFLQTSEQLNRGCLPITYHDRDVEDPQLFLCRLSLGLLSGVKAGQVGGPVLVVDVEEQGAILQPLLPPAHQRDVIRVPRDLCKSKAGQGGNGEQRAQGRCSILPPKNGWWGQRMHTLPAPWLPLRKSQPEGLKGRKTIFLGITQRWAYPKIQLCCRKTALTDTQQCPSSSNVDTHMLCVKHSFRHWEHKVTSQQHDGIIATTSQIIADKVFTILCEQQNVNVAAISEVFSFQPFFTALHPGLSPDTCRCTCSFCPSSPNFPKYLQFQSLGQ